MKQEIANIKKAITDYTIADAASLEDFKKKFISKNGAIKKLFDSLKSLDTDLKKDLGLLINELKNLANDKFNSAISLLGVSSADNTSSYDDFTLPTLDVMGGLHPITIIERNIVELFIKIGFRVAEGPEIEDDWHNFTALNFEKNHPARDMQDTFFIKNSDKLLRTHTSSVQIRVMEKNSPPLKIISLGRVFRNEAISSRANSMFHQVECLNVGNDISILDMEETIFYFVEQVFGSSTDIRFRSSFFPFTTPSIEVDITCQICNSKGCKICKQTGWVELGGAGMIDPNVLKNCNIEPKKYSGFAFGMGIERIAMLKYKIDDVRMFLENDIRFLKQFI
jgi:phenylalanyl-tRNA synthetase alpha chain